MTETVDPITLQVIGGALHAIAEQMGNVLYRMSYSSIIRESQDLGAGLFDRAFNTLAESDSTPMHIGSSSGWLMFAGIIMRPRATSSRTSSGEIFSRRAIYSISSVTTPRRA